MPRSAAEQLAALCTQARQCGHRQLAALVGEQGWCRDQCLRVLDTFDAADSCLLSDRTLGLLEPVEARHRLGGESDLLIVDGWAHPDINALAALAGTLRSGGLLLFLLPESRADISKGDSDSLFFERFAQLLFSEPAAAILREGGEQRLPRWRPPHGSSAPALPTEDQRRAIDAIWHVATGHRRRPLVLRSDRGRGKSAALGIACGEMLREDMADIVVTGPRPAAVEIVFRHARDLLPDSQRAGHRLHHGESTLRFVPPDVLLRERVPARLLLVDEAAAIPPALLTEMVQRYPRVVFATTVHGYEGSGRGFDVRFRHSLETLAPQWKDLWLQTPIRWAEDDPVEAFLTRWLLLDAEPAADAEVRSLPLDAVETRPLDREVLAQDEALMREFFGLLVVAHYQTSPEDLRLLLDAPDMQRFGAFCEGRLIAAALVMEEGTLEAALAEAIDAGQRRLRGHLLPQSMAFHCAAPEALQLQGARVARIAVHQALRRRGAGGALLRFIERQVSALGFDYIGSSFAADDMVVPFWLREEYSPLRLGTRRDTCSGSHALLVAKPLSGAGVDLVEKLHARFSRQFPVLLAEQFRQLPPALAVQLLLACGADAEAGEADVEEVKRYAVGVAQYDTGAAALWYYAVSRLGDAGRIDRHLLHLLVMKVLQHRPWAEVAEFAGESGRAGVDGLLRLAYRELLAYRAGVQDSSR